MKKIMLSIGVGVLLAASAAGQCEKNVTFTSSKTEYLDADGNLQRTQAGSTTVLLTPKHITLTVKAADYSDVIEGDVDQLSCSWPEAFKTGKTTFKTFLVKSNGETKDATATLEGKAGNLSLVLELENTNGLKLRLLLDGYTINP